MRFASLLLTTLALAACGSDEGSEGNGDRPPREVFAGTCGNCHTLADAGTDGTFGPNLDELQPDKAQVLSAIESGPGGMPAGLLDGAAADTVAEYVSGAASGG